MISFITEKEFIQAALDRTSVVIFDRASQILSDGNPVAESITTLATLSNAALNAGYSNTVINTYYTILEDEVKRSGDA